VTDAVFHLDGEHHVPTELARGPWDPHAQHGGAAAAILGRAIDRFEPELGLAVTRITFELLRPVPLTPLVVNTAMTRPGKRVQLVTASLEADEVEVVRATALRVLPVPRDIPDDLDPPDRPPPDPSAAPVARLVAQERPTNFSDAFELRLVDGQPFGTPGPSRMWFRLRVPVVAGEEPSPLQRILVASDFGNGISGVLDYERFVFINPDLTVYVRRPPVGMWVGLDASTWLEPGGGGYAESALYDERGRIGRAVQALYVAPR
jgi:Thioesterase-like superfamily